MRRSTAGEAVQGERCLRCAAVLEARRGTFHCPRCRLELACCEGRAGECTDESR